MDVEIRAEAAQFLFEEYINRIFFAVLLLVKHLNRTVGTRHQKAETTTHYDRILNFHRFDCAVVNEKLFQILDEIF
jgi:hypothetical protein